MEAIVSDQERPDLGGNYRYGDVSKFVPTLWRYLVDRFAVKSVLDVGCGEGHAVNFFHKLGVVAHGIDGLKFFSGINTVGLMRPSSSIAHCHTSPAAGFVRRARASATRHSSSNSTDAPLNAVSVPTSNGGDTSTRSAPTKSSPRSARSRRSASIIVIPPASGVPVPGACDGSSASMSKLK